VITIIDYGLGNILAFKNIYKRLNIPVAVAQTSDELRGATKLILPGVGSFDHAMKLLQASGMRPALDSLVMERGMPILGVCVGMQILAAGSEEGRLPGLGWIDGQVRRFDFAQGKQPIRLPHMGWNDVTLVGASPLFNGLQKDSRFYFLHSYYFCTPRREQILAEAEYGTQFSCALGASNIFGVQFHPEKSHDFGIRLLKNFGEM
jgi:imidazole glycerol-phosphate synthase subunit HisH